jgi:hypothetical protein
MKPSPGPPNVAAECRQNGPDATGFARANMPRFRRWRFQAKQRPVRLKKTRQIRKLAPRFDSIETEKALVHRG